MRIGHATESGGAALASSPDEIHSTPNPDPVQWLTVKEIPRRFSYHPEGVRQLIRQGNVEAVKDTGRTGWLVNTPPAL